MGVVDIKEKLLEAINQVEEISRVSVENTAQISGSTQEQVSGVQEILVSVEKIILFSKIFLTIQLLHGL